MFVEIATTSSFFESILSLPSEQNEFTRMNLRACVGA